MLESYYPIILWPRLVLRANLCSSASVLPALWLFDYPPVCQYLAGTSAGRNPAVQVRSLRSHITPSAPSRGSERWLMWVLLACHLSFHTQAEGCVPVQSRSPPVDPCGVVRVGVATLFINVEAGALPPSVYSPR